ncbi:MAG: GntR family transcriptional regulator [Planctomycetota bacterium]
MPTDGPSILNAGHPRPFAVFSLLRDRILGLEYSPGYPLTELALADELKVSRTPIREALRRLEHEELVKIIPNKGAIVVGISESDVCEAYLMRQALEGICARRTADLITPENLDRLEASLQEAKRHLAVGRRDEASEAADELHRMILDIGGAPRIRRAVVNLRELTVRLHRLASALPGRLERSVEEHGAVLGALRRRDGDEAERLIREHITSTERDVLVAFRNQGSVPGKDLAKPRPNTLSDRAPRTTATKTTAKKRNAP